MFFAPCGYNKVKRSLLFYTIEEVFVHMYYLRIFDDRMYDILTQQNLPIELTKEMAMLYQPDAPGNWGQMLESDTIKTTTETLVTADECSLFLRSWITGST